MRLISFKSLSIRNFLSVGQTPVLIDFKTGINVITGTNHDKEDSKNGVGKSTVVDALYFALFGATIRELNKDLIVNSQTKKTCEVELTFQVSNNGAVNNYKITRSINPTKCFITKDGVDITHSTVAKTNEYIQKLTRSTGKVFQNSVIMTINNTVPFMAQSKIDKRKFIESVLNLEAFTEMLSRARDEYNELKREYEVVYAKNQTIEKNLQFNRQQLELFEENKKIKISDLDKKITDNKQKIDELTTQIVTLPDNIDELITVKSDTINTELKAVQAEHKNAFKIVTELKTNIRLLKEQIDEIQSVGATCTTCKRPYSQDDIKHKEENISKLEKEIEVLEQQKLGALETEKLLNEKEQQKNNELDELNNKKQKINRIKSENSNIVTKINVLTESNNELFEDRKQALELSNVLLEKTVHELETECLTNKNTITKLDNELSVLECVKFVVSEEGVKSYIVRKILKILNSRLAHYLEALQANCLCQFNEYFEETVTDEKGVEKSYFNFSGGERKRIDLACLFAFLDIRRMQGDVHFSTIFYDELLDSSLDDKGVELVLNVLRERTQKYNENCYIVTHRGNAITAKVDNIVLLEKRNGFTYILK